MTNSPGHKTVLEGGLVMRGATRDDAVRLADYNAEMHTDPGEPPEWMWYWTHDLVSKPHPSMSLDDFILIEDTNTGQIVSSCVYFHQTWSYCGIPVAFGRPELVSTHPEYRNRGLIRRQFELMHRWGDERGHLVQGITGIPYYYRQFGYEMALEMGRTRSAPFSKLPSWKDDEERTVSLRPAERSDVPFISKLHKEAATRSLFSPMATPEEVEYTLFDRHESSQLARTSVIVNDESANPIGLAIFSVIPEFNRTSFYALEFSELTMFHTHTKPVLKALNELLSSKTSDKSLPTAQFSFEHFPGHPAHPFLGTDFVASGNSYAWYMRVPDLPQLIRLIAPKLEERLIGTVFEGLTGNKLLNFYRSGLLLKFAQGKLASVETTKFPEREKSTANLPDLTFLQLLFGRRSLSEINHMLVDARANSDEDELLIDTLFPKMSSDTRLAIS